MDLIFMGIVALISTIIAVLIGIFSKKPKLKILFYALIGAVIGLIVGYIIAPFIISFM